MAGNGKAWVSMPAQDAMAAIPEAIIGTTKNAQRVPTLVKTVAISYDKGRTVGVRGKWNRSEYDLSEIAKAEDTEAYVKLAFQQITTLILKEPWSISGRNDETVSYIHDRIRHTELATATPFDIVLRKLVRNFVRYSNAFLVKVRDMSRAPSTAKMVRRYGRRVAPVVGLFSLDPTSMEVMRDNHGTPIAWRQYIPGRGDREHRKENIVHMYFDQRDGFAFGTPWVTPVLDDIRSLRRIEELIEMLINRHLFPLFHYKVGTETNPAREYDNGMSEVDRVQYEIGNMPSEGSIVTPERHEIVAINPDPMDASKYLMHYENRVFTGLRLSTVDIGRGNTANRGTGQAMQAAKNDLAKDMQQVIREFITTYIFDEWLEEAGYNLKPENRVWFTWAPIDPEEQRARDQHAADQFNNNMLTHAEARERCGMQPINDGQMEDLHLNKIMKAQSEFEVELQTNSQKEIEKVKNVSRNKTRPTNQSGTKSAKGKTARDAVEVQVLDNISFAMGHLIDSILQEHGQEAIDWSSGLNDGLDREILEEYHSRFKQALQEAKLTTKQRASLKASSFCGPGQSFPVNDCSHYSAALRMLPRFKGEGDKSEIRACIESKGRKLGCPGAKKNNG